MFIKDDQKSQLLELLVELRSKLLVYKGGNCRIDHNSKEIAASTDALVVKIDSAMAMLVESLTFKALLGGKDVGETKEKDEN